MSEFSEPMVGLLLLGVVGGIGVVVAMLLQLRGAGVDRLAADDRSSYISKARPDRRVKRLDERVASSPTLRRAVEITANLADRRGVLGAVERALRAADVPVRPAEFLLAHVTASIALPVLTFLLTGSATKAIMMLLLMLVLPVLLVRFVVARRQKRFAAQLPDALTTLAGSLRAGRSLGQGMEALSRELRDPMGRELRKVMAEVRLGRTLQEALADASERIASDDFRWAVLAIQIQAEVGGNLAELLDQVSATMRERTRMKGEVKALTAEGRASALMLVVMVPALGAAMWVFNPSYMEPMFTTRAGHIMLGISAFMIGGGYLWMNSMVKIDV